MAAKSELSLTALKMLAHTRHRTSQLTLVALRNLITTNNVRTNRSIRDICAELIEHGFMVQINHDTYARTRKPYTKDHAARMQALVQLRRKPAPLRLRATGYDRVSERWAQMLGFPVRDIEVPVGRVHLLEGDNEE